MVNAAIRAQVTGYLLSQDYAEGSFVRKGQPLFRIDPRPFDAALAQAQGQLAQARGQLAQAKAQSTLQDRKRLAYVRCRGGVDTQLNALDSDRERFQAQLSLAEIRLNELLSVVQLYKALGGGWS